MLTFFITHQKYNIQRIFFVLIQVFVSSGGKRAGSRSHSLSLSTRRWMDLRCTSRFGFPRIGRQDIPFWNKSYLFITLVKWPKANAWSYTGKKWPYIFKGTIILRVCNLQKDSTMTPPSYLFRLSEWSFSAAPLAKDVHSTFFGLYRQVCVREIRDIGLPKLDGTWAMGSL